MKFGDALLRVGGCTVLWQSSSPSSVRYVSYHGDIRQCHTCLNSGSCRFVHQFIAFRCGRRQSIDFQSRQETLGVVCVHCVRDGSESRCHIWERCLMSHKPGEDSTFCAFYVEVHDVE